MADIERSPEPLVDHAVPSQVEEFVESVTPEASQRRQETTLLSAKPLSLGDSLERGVGEEVGLSYRSLGIAYGQTRYLSKRASLTEVWELLVIKNN